MVQLIAAPSWGMISRAPSNGWLEGRPVWTWFVSVQVIAAEYWRKSVVLPAAGISSRKLMAPAVAGFSIAVPPVTVVPEPLVVASFSTVDWSAPRICIVN